MKTAHTLLLASSSATRRLLVTSMDIPFKIINQDADESIYSWDLGLEEVVSALAVHKMAHAQLPAGSPGESLFVLTADTLVQDMDGTIYGKPADREAVYKALRAFRGGARISTGFCLERKYSEQGSWVTQKQHVQAVTATCTFNVPDNWLARYTTSNIHLNAAGGVIIEDFGMQFLESVQGSYTTILGLPLFQVRQALESFGFFE